MKKRIIPIVATLLLCLLCGAGCENSGTSEKSIPVVDDVLDVLYDFYGMIDEGRVLSHTQTDEAAEVVDMLDQLKADLYTLKKNYTSVTRLQVVIADYKALIEYPLGEEDRGHITDLTDALKSMIDSIQETMGKTLLVYEYEEFNSLGDDMLGAYSIYSVSGNQVWKTTEYGTPAPCATMSGYDSGNYANEDWLISPVLDFSNLTSATLSWKEAINYGSDSMVASDNVVKISSDYSGEGDPNNATWTPLDVQGRSSGESWTFVTTDKYDLSEYLGVGFDTVYIAFVYYSSSDEGTTWELDNVLIEGSNN